MASTSNRLVLCAAAAALALSGPAFGHGGGGGGSGGGGSAAGVGSGGGHSAGAAGASGGAGASAAGPGSSSAGASGTAAGGAGAGGDGSRGLAPACPRGYVLKAGSCLHARAGVLPDSELYAQGRALALAGHYAEALPILEAVTRTDDAMVFTMRGFATRKLGDITAAMRLYDKALAIEPDNVNTHEYMGEAYVEMGRPDLARAELARVERSCGKECEQYEDLARAIETGVTE